jgi:hypothetical protein
MNFSYNIKIHNICGSVILISIKGYVYYISVAMDYERESSKYLLEQAAEINVESSIFRDIIFSM